MRSWVCLLAAMTAAFGIQNVVSIRAQPESMQEPAAAPSGPDVSWHAPRSTRQPPGVTLVLDEVRREKGRKSTIIVYRVQTSGFPQDKTYEVLLSSLVTKWERQILFSGLRADASGTLIYAPDIKTITMKLEDYNRGESYRIEVVAEDESLYSSDTVFPFPIESQDGSCQVWAVLVSKDRRNFAMQGSGFHPSDVVRFYSTDGHDPREWTDTVDETGSFLSAINHGRKEGTAQFSVTAPGCKVTLSYDFGRKAKGPL
jgi:hypothetical protein